MIIKRKNKKVVLHSDHALPRTRRDFLSTGFMGFSALATMPTLFGLGMREAHAAACIAGDVSSDHIPFLVFDMAGGAGLPANFLVGKEGGSKDLLKSYDQLGWDPRESGALNEEFGLPMSAKYSGLLEGILANTSPATRANLRMGGFCHFAQDDTSSNPLNAASLVVNAGNAGRFITNGLGILNTPSGGNSRSALADTTLKPTYITGVDDILGGVSFGGSVFEGVGPKQLQIMAEKSLALSKLQVEKYAARSGGKVLGELADCAYNKSVQFLDGATGLDPRADANVQDIYGINEATEGTDNNVISAGVVMNCLKGYSGPGVWTLGGCDYHDGTATTGDRKDREMGVEMGRAFELANRLNKPFFFQLITDGGVGASGGSREWTSEAGDKCMTVVGYYDPAGAPRIIRDQVGHYTNGQSADITTLIGDSTQLVSYAVFANYLNCCGLLGKFGELVPGVFTDAGVLDSMLIFEGRV